MYQKRKIQASNSQLKIAAFVLAGFLLLGSVSVFISQSIPSPALKPETSKTEHFDEVGEPTRSRRLMPQEAQGAMAAQMSRSVQAVQGHTGVPWDLDKHTLLVFGQVTDIHTLEDLGAFRQLPERFNVVEMGDVSDLPAIMLETTISWKTAGPVVAFMYAGYQDIAEALIWHVRSTYPSMGLRKFLMQRIRCRTTLSSDSKAQLEYIATDRDGTETLVARLDKDQRQEVELPLLTTLVVRETKTGREVNRVVITDPGTVAGHSFGQCNYMEDPDHCKPYVPPFPKDSRVLAARQAQEGVRLQMMKDQPVSIKAHTRIGFKKVKMPHELYSFIRSYFELNKHNYMDEVWPPEHIYTNLFVAPTFFVPLPEGGGWKNHLFSILKPLLSEWAGGLDLTPTAMYGIRIYTRNSVLLEHVDKPTTHIVSAILNIAQDVDEPWPITLIDHSGKKHSVTMQPGEMVMYEGATCAHGRETPLKGRYFANVFTHFKPTHPEEY